MERDDASMWDGVTLRTSYKASDHADRSSCFP